MTCSRALRSLPVLVLAGASIALPSAGSSSARAPVAAAASSIASAVSAGDNHTCALTSAGGIKCWGSNGNGQLGDGTTTHRHTPVDVSGLASGVVAITAGGLHTCALTSEGGVKCWGNNDFGQLGDGTTDGSSTPVDVSGLTSGVVAITARGVHSCALTSAGGVKCWGANDFGELGDGTTTDRHTPVDVSGLTSGVVAITAGGVHSCALTSAGGVKCWGYNIAGELGDGTTANRYTPVDVSGLTSGIAVVAAGMLNTCALTSVGGVKCWGANDAGQLGDGTKRDRHTPVNVSGLTSGVVAVAAGFHHACARTGAGELKCWGANESGQLGDGTERDRHTPVNVSGLTRGLAAISAGGLHTCAVTSGGGIRCWGNNKRGQLGDDNACGSHCPTPVQVVGFGRAQCAVPKVTDKKLATAKQAIAKAHCSVGKLTRAYSKRVKKGRVISQKPKPGATLPAAWPVNLRVSKGPRL